MEVVEQAPYRFVIPRHGRMRVPGVVYATRNGRSGGGDPTGGGSWRGVAPGRPSRAGEGAGRRCPVRGRAGSWHGAGSGPVRGRGRGRRRRAGPGQPTGG